jgi:hypothetical protein
MNITRRARRGQPCAHRLASAWRVRALLAAGTGIALASLAVAGVAVSPAAASSSSGSTLTVQAQTAFSTFNPFTAYNSGDLEVINEIYPMLTTTSKQGAPEPHLVGQAQLDLHPQVRPEVERRQASDRGGRGLDAEPHRAQLGGGRR